MDCIIGPRSGRYARYTFSDGSFLYAHRVEWERVYGPIPDGYEVHHLCGTKTCINPEHMEVLPGKEHRARHRRCDHDPSRRRWSRDGVRSTCRDCFNEWQRKRWRERYYGDPAFREKALAHQRNIRESRHR